MSDLVTTNVDLMKAVDPKVVESIVTLNQGVVPEYAILEHPGKGGKTFKYLSHIWVTEQLRNALGQLWSFDVLETTVYLDGSVSARVCLRMHIPLKDGGFLETTITELGVFDGGGGKMATANMVASAVSRGLVRCVMCRFGLGAQLYGEEGAQPTAKSAWNSLLKYGTYRGLTQTEIIGALRTVGITSDQLLDRFNEAYETVARVAAEAKEEPIPAELR